MSDRHDAASLARLLQFRAGEDPDRIAYTFLENGEVEQGHATYRELDLRARAVAARLQALGARGERALLLYPPGLEYVAALFGCFYAGVVAVPAYPPRRNKPDPRLQGIVADCAPALALTTRELLGEAERLCAHTPELAALRWMATEDVPGDEAGGWRDPGAGADTLAFLQYTSGSTAAPKGVMVSHGNLLHNSALIERLAGYTPQTRSVIWLPPYHDMGLIGGILQPLFTGYWAALFSPVAFIQRPARWLEAVSRYGATSSGGPNFAYELCVHAVRPEERAALDLSRWEVAFNGAEPVRHETLRAFSETFAECGFRARAFYPCYGLAEATLMVTGSRPAEEPVVRAVDADALGSGDVVADPEGEYRLVGSGRSAESQRVLIVDPATLRECPADRVGEVWVAGPSVARGYWGRPEVTAEAFAGFVAGTGEGPFLRTGDLGFLGDGGELFVTGRLKDLIVIRGRNHYPQDVEMTALRSHPGLRAGSGAAFGVEQGGEERLVVVQEVSRQAAAGLDVEEVAAAIRRAVAAEHGLLVHAVAVVRPGGVPKTTSGKVQRRACRARFLAGDLPLVGVSVREHAAVAAPRSASTSITREALEAVAAEERQALVEALLVEHAARVLGVDPARVDREQPLVALGLDSLRAMELKGALEASLGAAVPVSALLDDTRLDRLAAELLEQVFLADVAVPAGVAPAGGDAPLSFAQERLWFLDRLQPGSAAYNIPLALRVRGGIDAGVLARALEEIVRRHEALRTVFASVEGRPVQRVRAPAPVLLPVDDLRDLPAAGREAEAQWIARGEAGRPFDLAAGPLLRARLVRLGEDEQLLVLVMHHIVGDGGSAGVLLRELGALYPALLAGEDPPLPPLPTQYAGWALRQRESLRGETVEAQLAWWRERLRGVAPLPLPTDRPRPPVQSFRGAAHRFEVPAEVMDGVRALARPQGATPFMALLAAWSLLLARYAGEGDVAVGTTVSSRDRAEVAGLVGLFVNTLVLRVEVAPEDGFRALLARARTAALEAFGRQDVPFERLVEEVQPERDLSRNPLFQVMLAPQYAAAEPVEVAGATLVPEPLDAGAAIVDLTLYTRERSGGALEAALEYATDLFEPATAGRMAAHLVRLLDAVAAEPDRPVGEVGFLLPAERAQLLGEWTDTGADYPAACLHELFAAQAARTPDAAAVRFAGRAVTYAELERSANRLAHHLRAHGVGPESRVGLCVERTPEMLAAMLAILKAGGAYVPLDPAYPAGRLEYMLEDAGARLVVSQSAPAERLPAGVARVLVDAEAERIAAQPDAAPESGVEPGSLAYVLYTSGSTGRPKGVQVEHRSASQVVHFLRGAVRPEDRAAVLGSTSVSFDVSVGEIFGTLCWGGTLVLVENVLELPRVAEEGVRLVVTVPGAAAELLAGGGIPDSVRAFNLAGEALPAALARGLYALPRVERVLNLYGPTEDTVYSTWSAVERGAERVRIGRPVPGSRAYVLDPAGNPAPVGVAGELCLAGAGVARGYHGRPGLTAERFVPDPFPAQGGARMYRTGDRARRLADGELEYLGRIDHQVKVRGFRIEPGEVESALLEHPSVGQAVVAARGGPGGTRLVAYVVPAEGEAAPAAAGLRAFLRERLPDYMVPSAFVALETLPTTGSGKTDRRALPEPEPESAAAESAAPGTPTEEILAGIWAQVLGVGRVGAHDDFFALGGHSLLGTQVVSRVRAALGVELPLRALFEAPTVAGLAGRVEALRRDGGPVAPPIGRAPRGGVLPASFAQQRLWMVDRLEPGSAAYNMAGALRLRGRLSAAALRAGLDALVRRHETLRTTFPELDGAPVQAIHPPAPAALAELDLRRLPEAEREAGAERLAAEEALRPFDLARGPLLRCVLLRLDEEDHVLCFTLHHVVGDGWSLRVLVQELSVLYAALERGEEPRLPELPVQYADYAAWQREWLSGETLDAQLSYWKERLAGAPPLLELPTDRPRAVGQGARAGSHRFPLSAETTGALRALARREGATLFMTLLAGWQALLHRWAGQEDVVVGSPVAGRTHAETEGLVGFFVNLLPLRGDLAGDPSWAELVGRVRETALGAYAHQELPFERLVEELGVERSLAHTPVFQATFALEPAGGHHAGLSLGEARLEPFGTGTADAKFDLALVVRDDGEALAGTLEYRAALFEADTVARLAGHLGILLDAMAAEPSRRLREVPLLRGSERRQVLETWNATAADYPRGCVHELVSAQAARTPRAEAVVFAGRSLGYAELERRANALAHRLRRLGVGPEVRVGVCLERTPRLVVALLAVLKAGGAYVPLDPAYPRERLRWMQEDAGVSLVLTSGALAGVLPAGVRALALDALPAADEAESDGPPEPGVLPENLSHVIFTSGSTGRPKGVMIRHSSVVVLLHWLRENVSDAERASVLFATSVSFDVSVAEVFGTLAWGGRLVMVENALELAGLDEPVVAAGMVPTAAAELLRAGGIPASVRTLNLAGEALPADLAQALLATGTVETVRNLYGPTEDTTYSTCSLVERGADRVTVGRPVANTQALVLDAELQPAPVGVPGELYLAGDGLARGYQARPDLTAERFLPNPYGAPGSRMYRVMDRVRWRTDGTLEYLGRTDFQVKVRGFRIEPGEIESALRSHPAVREAVAVVREDAPGDRRIVAYVVAAEGAAADAAALRVHLRERVPEYMLPAAFVALAELPLTPGGKLDRRALPAPGPGGAGADASAAPRTPSEELLAGIFAEVLGVGTVGRDDDFFELGGHSLLATRAASRARRAFGVDVPLRTLFQAPTPAALAEAVDGLLRGGARAAAPPIVPLPRDGRPLPLSFAQQRLWFIDRLQPGGAAYNIPAALRIRGAPDVGALRRAFTELARRHEALRTVLVEAGGEAVQVVLPPAPVPLPVLDFSGLAGESRRAEALRRAGEEGRRPFDLSRGPLLRLALARLADEEWLLCFTMHHVVSDGWSIGVLVREIAALYGACSRGLESPLPELEVQYADYAAWQRERLTGEVLEEHLRFWREHLAGAPPLLELPTDHPRRGGLGATATGRGFTLSAETARALRGLGRREGATLFMTLLAGWQTLLARYSGQDDVVVGTPIANRPRAEVEGLIGVFVNTLALRADLRGDPAFRELLGRQREAMLGAFAHQDLPFERLVEELAPERSLAHNPLFQVMFVLQNLGVAATELGELDTEAPGGGAAGAQFDLAVTFFEDGERLQGRIDFRTDLFDGSTIERMAEHYRLLLESAAADPDRRASGLRLMSAAEERRVLVEWNAPRAFPEDRLVPRLAAEQAERTPDAPAVTGGGAALTYADLEARAGRLAQALRELGVGPEVPVGVLLERGPALLEAVLGIWKAGGAFLPLDPTYPAERLDYMLRDARVPVLVSQERLAGSLPSHGARVLLLDADAARIAARVPARPVEPDGSWLAYVIYTSGSTGRPKGVRVSHRALLHTLLAEQEAFGAGAGEESASLTSFGFDVWLVEAVLPLLSGGVVRMVPRETVLDTRRLVEELAGSATLQAVPSLMREIVRALRARGSTLPGLRRAFVGGEAVSPELLDEMREAFPAAELHVMYGPTEAAVDCAGHRVREGEARRHWVGRPLGNASLYVLDRAGRPVPAGVPGELHVGGASLARDYLGRPELTAERFVPDPFSGEPGARVYRTGDRVRWTAEGELEFLGRVDHQVKIRGLRVEPGEVEAVLAGCPAVSEAVVAVREDASGGAMLVAYLVPAAGQGGAALVDELRAHLRGSLPEQMVPAAFVLLDSLPLSPNGKIDRGALPAPARGGGSREGGAPLTATERALAAVWEEVLGVGDVGVGDNFFDLGGHSLLLVQVHSRLQERFPDRVALVDLFTHRTLGSLAAYLDRAGAPPAPPAAAVRDAPALPDP
ncbi:MAG: amino acid adenylation domain-containing protein, partial [Gemmatimonadota bacterium]